MVDAQLEVWRMYWSEFDRGLRLRGPCLGQGSFGQVFGGELHGRPCAIKITKGFREEVAACQVLMQLAESQHMRCAVPFAARRAGGMALIAMPQLGPNLRAHCRTHALSLERVRQIGHDVLEQLQELHLQANLVHGDVSPRNLVLDRKLERCSLVDFGMACSVGTPRYKPQGTTTWAALMEKFPCHALARDDLQSFCFTLCHLWKRLPWSADGARGSTWEAVTAAKRAWLKERSGWEPFDALVQAVFAMHVPTKPADYARLHALLG